MRSHPARPGGPRLAITLGCFLLAVSPGRLCAQGNVELEVAIGAYSPTSDFRGLPSFAIPGRNKQQTALAASGAVGLWLTNHIGIGLRGTVSPSDVRSTSAAVLDSVADAHITIATLQLLLVHEIPDFRGDLRLGFGPALISHGGPFYRGYSGTTEFGGAVSATGELRMTPSVMAQLGVDGYVYPMKLQRQGAMVSHNTQIDLVMRAGLAFRLGH